NRRTKMASLIGDDDGRGFGVKGTSQTGEGVHGETNSDTFAGAVGISNGPGTQGKNPAGVFGKSLNGEGVHGETNSTTFAAVAGLSNAVSGNSAGVFGKSKAFEGVHGKTESSTFAAVAGISLNQNGTGPGIFGKSNGKGPAGFFEGNAVVTGVLTVNGD